MVEKSVHIRGATGNPEDVIVDAQRILGKKPDAGCYERFDGGLMLIVR